MNIFKKRWGIITGIFIALIFAVKIRAAEIARTLYGPPTPSPGMIQRLLSMIGIASMIFVVAPIVGLFWYRKRGGTKKWPSFVVGIIAILFILLAISFIILTYLYSGGLW